MQRRVAGSYVPDVAFEMLYVNRVETDDGRKETDVCFCYCGAEVVGSSCFGKVGFGAVEGGKQGSDSLFVGILSPGEVSA